MQMFWFGNEKKGKALGPFSVTPDPLSQREGSRMLRKWRVKGAQLGGKR